MGKLRGVGLVTLILAAAAAVTTQACEDDSSGAGKFGLDASTGSFEAGARETSVPDAPVQPPVDAAPDAVAEAAPLNDGSAPVENLTRFDNPRAMSADGTFLYIATSNGVFRVARDGSSTVGMSVGEATSSLTRDGARVFYTTDKEVKMLPLAAVDGGGGVTLLEDGGGHLPVHASAGTVYYGAYKSSFGSEILAVDEDGGNPRLAAGGVRPYDFAAVGTMLFAASMATADQDILQLPGDGGAGVSRATAFGLVSDFAARDGYVYWSTRGGTVKRIPVAAGAEETIATGEGTVAGIAVDAANIYWVVYEQADPALGRVRRAPKAGGAAITLASNQLSAFSIAVDDTHVYWAALRADGGVNRVPK